jgi:microsomal dipeptidase-like Zn-dependent dipeptidase
MLIDLHAHYPMRVIGDVFPDTAYRQLRRARGRPTFRDRLRAVVLRIASTFFSHRNAFSDYRITVPGLREGDVGVAISVLTRPFDEVALGKPYPSPPASDYFTGLLDDWQKVEDEVATHDPAVIRLVHDRQELDRARADGATALVHGVEGAFSLGDGVEEIRRNVAELRRRGVVYITLAHLLYRHVATNCSALPFLSDARYDKVFPQPPGVGLTERGVAALGAMVEHRVLLDVSHMRREALDHTFTLLDGELDPECEFPVLATHAGYRFGEQQYMLDKPTILQIKRRKGVVGLILAQHQLNDGLRDEPTRTFDDSLEVLFRHIDKIAEITGSHEYVAIGTDFDGFIKPTLSGLERMADLPALERALRDEYKQDAELMLSANALRVLHRAWP